MQKNKCLALSLMTKSTINRQFSMQLDRQFNAFKAEPNLDYSRYKDIRFAILGGGAFSLALAKVISYKNISSTLLVRNQSVAEHINEFHYHPKYLTDSILPKQLIATSDPVIALMNATYIIHAVPMQQSRKFLEYIKPFLPVTKKIPILSVAKGVEQKTFCLMNDIINQTLGEDYPAAYLSGPSFAMEIMNGEATAVVIASTVDNLSSELAEILSSIEFRCHTSRDVKVFFFVSIYFFNLFLSI
jgi:glycerol-3-phosphate dehydrogenase (NAD+)